MSSRVRANAHNVIEASRIRQKAVPPSVRSYVRPSVRSFVRSFVRFYLRIITHDDGQQGKREVSGRLLVDRKKMELWHLVNR